MNGNEHARSVVASFERTGASVLSVQAAAERLIAEKSWPARLTLLAAEPRLVDGPVARWCSERGEDLLAAVISRASEVGVEAVRREVPSALALAHVSRDDDTTESSQSTGVVIEALALVAGGATWLWPLVAVALDVLATRIHGHADVESLDQDGAAQLAALREAVEPVLVSAAGCEAADVARVLALARADWDQVWAALPTERNVTALERACVTAQLVAQWFETDGRVMGWIEDLQNLLKAARQRGAETAALEHRLVLYARSAPLNARARERDRAHLSGVVARECATYFQRTGAVWVLQAAIEAARAAYRLTLQNPPDRAEHASTLGGVLAEAVEAGILEPTALAEAVNYQREAYHVIPQGHPNRAGRASNLGNVLTKAVQAGIIDPAALTEAVNYQREAYQLTPHGHPNRATFASNLGNRLSEAVEAGTLEPAALTDAVNYQREAYQLTPHGHPNRAMFASNLGTLLVEAVEAGILEPAALTEAVNCQREAYQLTPEGHPRRAGRASNLGTLLAEAVETGILEPTALTEAVNYHREAYQLTPKAHLDRAPRAANLGSRLVEAVNAGILEPATLTDAINYHREAYQLTPQNHPERAVYASDLGTLLAEAVQAGILEPTALTEAVNYQREAYQLTPKSHPNHAAHASSLGSRLVETVQAGILEPAALTEAMNYHREAYQLTPQSHPHRAMQASNLGTVLAEAVGAGILEPAALTEAVNYQREAYQLIPQSHPHRAMQASNLGTVLAEAVQAGILEPAALSEAVNYQREAYQLTPESHPNRAAQASNLGSRLSEAVQAGILEPAALTEAVDEVSALLDELWRLARRGVTLTHRRHVLSRTRGASTRLPLTQLRRAGPEEAVRAVEALRGHLTGGMRAPQLRPGSVDPALEAAYRQAAGAYERTQVLAREGLASYADASPRATRLAELVEQVRASAPELSAFGGRPLFTGLCAGLPKHAAGIYLIPAAGPAAPGRTEEWPGAAVIVRSDGRTTQVSLPELTQAAVLENVQALLDSSATAQRVCAWLWQAVAEPLLAHGGPTLTEASEWVIVPSGHLGLLPLHAAGSAATGWLDDYTTVRLTPSLLSLIEPETATPAGAAPLIAISKAPDLSFLAADRPAALALIPNAELMTGSITPDTVLKALVEAPVAVLCGHAAHSLKDGGGLHFNADSDAPIAASGPRWLTAPGVEQLPLRDRQWVFLSACSSGQTATDLPDEAVGLPAAFRYAGFRTVIATTWPVKDHIAFITLALFLQHRAHQPQDSVGLALRRTRTWLRAATRGDLLAWLSELATTVDIPVDLAEALRQWWANCPDFTPHADPQDWAPYAATGH